MSKPGLAIGLAAVLAATLSAQDVFEAIRKGDAPAVRALVEKSPSLVDARDGNGRTPLHGAAAADAGELVAFLIAKGAKLDAADVGAKTPLHLAAMNDRAKAAAALLAGGAPLETRDDYGRTALLLCARERGQAATGRLLIEAGADVNAADKFGSTALELAAWRGKAAFVDLLLEKGARVPESGRAWGELIFQAASNGLPALFARLTDKGQGPKELDPSGQTLLHAAAAGGSAEIVDRLIGRGLDPLQADGFGWTPLHFAARDGRLDAVRALLERGAALEARTLMGQSAYDVAKERGMEAAAALLAGRGADRGGLHFPVLAGAYLGQKPPAGGQAELFAPGIISSVWGLHSAPVFSPDGTEVYWAPMMTFPGETYSRGGLMMMKRTNGRWAAPVWAPFSGPDVNDDVPFFSPDGRRIYFVSSRPLAGETGRGSERIWTAERTAAGWSEPRPLDPGLNAFGLHWQFSRDARGDLYFGARAADSRGGEDIYRARWANGTYVKPVNVGPPVNTAAGENTPFVAPDGSYLLFCREFDIWASFRGPDGAWTEPVRLGPEVNSPSIEICPIVTADGRYLFFLSRRGGESHAYWTSAAAVAKLKPSGAK